MSPGAFWGHPGVAGAGPNPFINPAVGAPVHVVQGSPGGFFFHSHPSPGVPGSVGVEIGSGRGGEPGGYFDSMTYGGQGYFPPVQSYFGGLGASSVEDEILKDKKDKEEDKEDKADKAKALDESNPAHHEQVFSGPASPNSGSGDSYGEPSDRKSPTFVLALKKEGFGHRAHSLSTDVMERPQLQRPESDPAPTV